MSYAWQVGYLQQENKEEIINFLNNRDWSNGSVHLLLHGGFSSTKEEILLQQKNPDHSVFKSIGDEPFTITLAFVAKTQPL